MEGGLTPNEATRPAFEVRSPDGQYFAVWADGRVEGFPPNSTIVNRIPILRNRAIAEDRLRR